MGIRWDGNERRKGERRGAASFDPEGWDHIRYCQTCRKTRFVEWLHRNCPPDFVMSESEARVMDGNR